MPTGGALGPTLGSAVVKMGHRNAQSEYGNEVSYVSSCARNFPLQMPKRSVMVVKPFTAYLGESANEAT